LGAQLICFDNSKEHILAELGEPYRMGIFDPRLPHMVQHSKEFKGTRFCVIFFKMWDSGAVLAPFENVPHYLEENVFGKSAPESPPTSLGHLLNSSSISSGSLESFLPSSGFYF